MKKIISLALFLTAAIALAEEPEQTTTRASGTNIIGSQEAPTVLNVVPWKDRKVQLEKKDPTSSVLDRVLEPLDRDVLMREVEYYNMLNGTTGSSEQSSDGLFLD